MSAFIHFVTKIPSEPEPNLSGFKETLNQIDKYVNDDFINKQYEVLFVDPKNVFQTEVKKIPYQQFCKYHFKDVVFDEISDYTRKYIAFIPKDILKSLFKIEDTLKQNLFIVPEDHGISMDISNAKIQPEAISYMRNKLFLVGKEILKLNSYVK